MNADIYYVGQRVVYFGFPAIVVASIFLGRRVHSKRLKAIASVVIGVLFASLMMVVDFGPQVCLAFVGYPAILYLAVTWSRK